MTAVPETGDRTDLETALQRNHEGEEFYLLMPWSAPLLQRLVQSLVRVV
jgi:hypothetical protein